MAQAVSAEPQDAGSQGTESATLAIQLELSGGTISQNRADAEALGKFITHIAEANKIISNVLAENRYEDSKDQQGRATHRKVKVQPLELEGAISRAENGVIELIFRAPAMLPNPLATDEDTQLPLEDLAEDTIESQALRTIFETFTQASEEDTLDAEEIIEPLETQTAREAVRRAASVLHHKGWELTGRTHQRYRDDTEIIFNSRGQARLADALKADLIGKYQARLRGTIDGHKNSNNTIYFRPNNSSQSWSMVAATDVLYAEAARISLDAENQVDLTIEFEPKADRQGNPTDRLVRRIVALNQVAQQGLTEPLF